MAITFLGTAAAQGYPDPFCGCANCEHARVLGGPSLRRRASALVNNDLALDFGPDLIAASHDLGVPLTELRYVLLTHAHSDHVDPAHFLIRSREYGVPAAPRLHVYASGEALRRVSTTFERDLDSRSLFSPEAAEELNLALHEVEPFTPFAVGPYEVTAFPANHGGGALLYAIAGAGRTILYATDTAAFPEATWRGVRASGLRFDLAVLDHTYGFVDGPRDHLTAHELIAHAARLRSEGLLAEHARIVGTHIAHDTNPPHPELAALAAAQGYEMAFDGLRI